MTLRHLFALLALFAGLSVALLAPPWRPIFDLGAILQPWPELPNYPSTLGLRKHKENGSQVTSFLTYNDVTGVQDFYDTALRNDGWSYQEYVLDNCSYVNRYFKKTVNNTDYFLKYEVSPVERITNDTVLFLEFEESPADRAAQRSMSRVTLRIMYSIKIGCSGD